MTPKTKQSIQQLLKLKPEEKVEIVNQLLHSLDQPDEQMDELWREEVSRRVKAYREGKIKAVSLEQILSTYRS